MTVAGEAPSNVSVCISNTGDQEDNGTHECNSSGEMKPCWGNGIEPRGGEEFNDNGPNLTEDISHIFWTPWRDPCRYTKFRNGIKHWTKVRYNILMVQTTTNHALARATEGNDNWGPVLKVRDKGHPINHQIDAA